VDSHAIADRITALITQAGAWCDSFEHEPVRTSEEAAALRPGYTLRQGAKAIIVRTKLVGGGRSYVMLVIPADRRFDGAKVKRLLHAKEVRFATEAEVSELTDGVQPGGVPPFGNLFELDVVSDPTLYDNADIVFNAGRTTTIAMHSADYRRLAQPTVADIVAQ
jgi:prolyl-tRNA editing enzyme YbaK/EbsC (Cys-tRNA(Pro) deacylase)